jgi:hypothetical protein
VQTSDLLTLVGIVVSLATAVAAIVVAMRSDHRQKSERKEDLRARAADAASVALTYLHIYAINAVPMSREGTEGRFDDWRRRMDTQHSLAYQELMKLKVTTSDATVRQLLEEALDLLPQLAMQVEIGIRLLSQNDPAAPDQWLSAQPHQQRLLAIHSELTSLLELSPSPLPDPAPVRAALGRAS